MHKVEYCQPIVDYYFMESLKRVAKEHKSGTNYTLGRVVVISLIFMIHVFIYPPEDLQTKEAFSIFLTIILIFNQIQLTHILYFTFKHLKNKTKILKIADQSGHCMSLEGLNQLSTQHLNEQMMFFSIQNKWRMRVSCSCYDFENMEKINDVSEENRQMRQSRGNKVIRATMESKMLCYRWLSLTFQVLEFGLFIYSVVLAIQAPLPSFQNTFIQLYVLFEIMLKPKILIASVLIFLLPLILLVAGIYMCCCRRQKKIDLPKVTLVSRQSIEKCSECSICFQTFIEGQKIIPLDCSEMHIFHETCITGWSKVKATCPICRSQI